LKKAKNESNNRQSSIFNHQSQPLLRGERVATDDVLIVGALPRELAWVRRAVEVAERRSLPECAIVRGRLEGRSVIVATTGDGERNAAKGIGAVLDTLSAAHVIVVGISGGLSLGLAAGQLLAAREVRDRAGVAAAPDLDLTNRIIRRAGATGATLYSSADILWTADSKAEVYATLGGRPVAAVDVETAVYARAAASRGIPYAALRVVLDPAEESLPLDFNTCRDSSGSVSPFRVATRALARRTIVPALWRLRGRVAECSRRLAAAVRQVLQSGDDAS
jgi:adenosylhomocysteine nucleosidase